MIESRDQQWLVHPVTRALRTAGLGLVAAMALSLGLVRPDQAEVWIGVAAMLLALVRLAIPGGSITTTMILVLVIDYIVATRSVAPGSRVLASAGVAIGLYAVHSLAALEAAIPPHVLVDRTVLRRFVARTCFYCAVGGASSALTTLVSTDGPRWAWLGVLAVCAALALAALPMLPFWIGRREPRIEPSAWSESQT